MVPGSTQPDETMNLRGSTLLSDYCPMCAPDDIARSPGIQNTPHQICKDIFRADLEAREEHMRAVLRQAAISTYPHQK